MIVNCNNNDKKIDNEFKKWKVWMGSCSGPVRI